MEAITIIGITVVVLTGLFVLARTLYDGYKNRNQLNMRSYVTAQRSADFAAVRPFG